MRRRERERKERTNGRKRGGISGRKHKKRKNKEIRAKKEKVPMGSSDFGIAINLFMNARATSRDGKELRSTARSLPVRLSDGTSVGSGAFDDEDG